MFTAASPIRSAQTKPHADLAEVIGRHLQHPWQRPIADHTRQAYERLCEQLTPSQPLILDSCCGTGASSSHLAQQYPDCQVIGVDQSAARLNRYQGGSHDNLYLMRANVVDFWRLLVSDHWRVQAHYLLYPNPWPKIGQWQRRWQGLPVWPYLLLLGGRLELRTNWQVYAQEFHQALVLSQQQAILSPYNPRQPITLFEAKYQQSGHPLWRVVSDLDTQAICLDYCRGFCH